jgi:hypothetical protein
MFPKYMRVELEAPDGTIFSPSDAISLPNAEYVLQEGHLYYRWQFPTLPGKPDQHKGAWKVWVENHVHGEQFYEGVLTYSVMAKARSDFRLGGRVLQADYKPGSSMEVILEPTLYGLPVELDEPVRVRITRPDGVRRTLQLSRDGFGAYRSTFTDTGLVGPYLIQAEVSASSPADYRITRFRQMTGLIFLPGEGDGGDQSDDELCREARRALKILHALVERCCEERDQEKKRLYIVNNKKLIAEVLRRLDDEEDQDCCE